MCAFIVRANSPHLIFLLGSICSAMTVSSPYWKRKRKLLSQISWTV